MLAIFRDGVKELREILLIIIGAGDLSNLESLTGLPDRHFTFPVSLWTRIIYDYALAYYKKKLPAEHLLKSLTPLYLGKTVSFVQEMENLEQAGVETAIEKLCLEFEREKNHLINNWI